MIVECIAYVSYIIYNKVLYLLFVDLRSRKKCFPRKFKNGVVFTTINPEHQGQSLNNHQEESQYRQDEFPTVYLHVRWYHKRDAGWSVFT